MCICASSFSVNCVYNKVDNSETRMFPFFFIDEIFRAPSIALGLVFEMPSIYERFEVFPSKVVHINFRDNVLLYSSRPVHFVCHILMIKLITQFFSQPNRIHILRIPTWRNQSKQLIISFPKLQIYLFTKIGISYSSLPFSTKPIDFQNLIESSFMLFNS